MDHSSASMEMKMDGPSPSSMREIRAGSSHATDLVQPLRRFLDARVSPDGPPRIEAVARAARCSVRTLLRRLGEVGVTYSRPSHAKWECKHHVVFIPKYRKKAI